MGGNLIEEYAGNSDSVSKEHWDLFFTKGGCDESLEWYAEWPQLQGLITSYLVFPSSSSQHPESSEDPPPTAVPSEELSILVPGCGNSRLSEHLYDAGFTNITNVDFSKVVISHMIRGNVRERPLMKWRVMDMRFMEFEKETFDAILDKGGLDNLMDPEVGREFGIRYLSQVKRSLKDGGKYICVTLAEPGVLDLLFRKFCFGWKLILHAIALEPRDREQAFMVVAEKLVSTVVSHISLFLDEYSAERHGYRADKFNEALEREKMVRTGFSIASDVFIPLEDLILVTKANLTELEPGRRVKFILGEIYFAFDCILLDAQLDSGFFSHQFCVFVVPKLCTLGWMLSFSEEQWLIVESCGTARLLMVMLDSRHTNLNMDEIEELCTYVKKVFSVGYSHDEVDFPVMILGDRLIKQRKTVHQVTSALNGLIVIEDLIYERAGRRFPPKHLTIRRLTIESVVLSEVLVSRERRVGTSNEVEKKKGQATSKTRKKGKHRKSHSHSSGSPGEASSGIMKVHNNYLTSPQHNGIISGLMLFSVHLKRLVKTMVIGLVPLFKTKTLVIGLGAGLLPMFMNNNLPFLDIEVLELDPVMLDVAEQYFDFREDERLKVNITNPIEFIMEKANSHEAFVMESVLWTVKDSLSEEGLYVINLATTSSRLKGQIHSRLKKVFGNVFSLQLEEDEEDSNEVIFALNTDSFINEDHLSEAWDSLATSLEIENQEWRQKLIEASRFIKPL
ncbi:hypothetical protein DH2020_019672 [Rehmannia glutinosa]|uniref:Methyltransferase type 11 domain-containing protein n=1 Tax=Rehmannia glutinosa TaxID=99300 RepID=A0ABR0WG33_REHGL